MTETDVTKLTDDTTNRLRAAPTCAATLCKRAADALDVLKGFARQLDQLDHCTRVTVFLLISPLRGPDTQPPPPGVEADDCPPALAEYYAKRDLKATGCDYAGTPSIKEHTKKIRKAVGLWDFGYGDWFGNAGEAELGEVIRGDIMAHGMDDARAFSGHYAVHVAFAAMFLQFAQYHNDTKDGNKIDAPIQDLLDC